MTPYQNRKPRYVREWYLKLKIRMKEIKSKRNANEAAQLQINDLEEPNPSAKVATLKMTTQKLQSSSTKPTEKEPPIIMKKEKQGDGDFDEPLPYFEGEEDEQQNWDDELCEQLEFSDDETTEKDNSVTIKSAGYYMVPIIAEKKGRISNKVDETKY